MTQTWMNQRFLRLGPNDFDERVHFVSIGNVSPLADVQNIWTAVAKGQDVSMLVPILKVKRALFIFASPIDQGQVAKLRDLIQCMDAVDSPPMVWAPHTVTPEIRPHNAMIDTNVADGQSTVSSCMELGLDGIISGEPQGQTLALILRMWVHKLEIAAETLSDVLQERRRKAYNVEYYKGHTDSLLWDYLRSRIAPVIPPCDRYLPSGEPSHIDGWAFGSARRTTSGMVYRLNRRRPDAGIAGGGSNKEVAFLVEKQTVRNVTQMMALKRMVDALWMVSCDKWQHPNIQRLFQVYHSQTHIIMRMEYAGAGNLQDRLYRLERRPLSFMKTSQILQQIFRAVAHLHLGPRVCHRDIKPENFDLHETLEMVSLKLTGFQLAFVVEDCWCVQSCGTVPFVAPEVLKGERYDGMCADLWGVGVTCLEILCGPRTVEKVLGLLGEEKAAKAYRRPDETFLANVIEVFQEPGAAGRILQKNCLPDFAGFRLTLAPLVNALLAVNPEERATANDLATAAEQIPKGPPAAPPASPATLPLPDADDEQSVQFLDETHGNITSEQEVDDNELVASPPLVRNESAKTAGTFGGHVGLAPDD